jgi:hypothetical protein
VLIEVDIMSTTSWDKARFKAVRSACRMGNMPVQRKIALCKGRISWDVQQKCTFTILSNFPVSKLVQRIVYIIFLRKQCVSFCGSMTTTIGFVCFSYMVAQCTLIAL